MTRTVLKLGGSVITEKDRAETLDGRALDRAADVVAAAGGWSQREPTTDANGDDHVPVPATPDGPLELVLVHGGGSFGHHHAAAHEVGVELGTHDAGGALAVHGAMTTLNRFVLSRLHARGVPAVPVHPLSTAARAADGTLSLPLEQVRTLLDEGFVPVLHGDLVAHAGEGTTVLSGDEIVTRVATDCAMDRVGLCSTVPGVLDEDEEVIDEIRSFETVADALGASDATDVTGGMAGKVRTLLDVPVPAHVFDLDSLDDFLAGDAAGTRIESE